MPTIDMLGGQGAAEVLMCGLERALTGGVGQGCGWGC